MLMSLDYLIIEALKLMFIGMFCVGAFLSILVVIIPLLNKITPDEALPTVKPTVSKPAEPDTLIAVISTAVHQYRNRHH